MIRSAGMASRFLLLSRQPLPVGHRRRDAGRVRDRAERADLRDPGGERLERVGVGGEGLDQG
jgi:hypothetical protein